MAKTGYSVKGCLYSKRLGEAKCGEARDHVIGKRCGKPEGFSRDRDLKGVRGELELANAKRRAGRAVLREIAVFIVGDDRAADGREMDADLVHPAGHQAERNERRLRGARFYAI